MNDLQSQSEGTPTNENLKEQAISILIDMSGKFAQSVTNSLLKSLYYDNENEPDKKEIDYLRYLIELLHDLHSIKIDEIEMELYRYKANTTLKEKPYQAISQSAN